MSLGDVEVGKEYDGVVVSIRDFGAFVNIGAQTDGLLHISQASAAGRVVTSRCGPPAPWRGPSRQMPAGKHTHAWVVATPTPRPTRSRPLAQISTDFVRNVGDILANGQEVRVRVMNIDGERGKFAVTMIPEGAAPPARAESGDAAASGERPQLKQQARAAKTARKAPRAAVPVSAGDVIKGKVASVAPFGLFVEVGGGFTGLLHETEMVRGEGAAMPAEGEEVEVTVVSVRGDKIQLSQRSAEELQQVRHWAGRRLFLQS